ncbi:MAG TPA: FtsX-like permease family protein, partial [Longimicrobiales bacterium]
MRPWRLGATMFTLFGLLALVVAAVGLYGVIAYDVAQRAPEMAIRMAMGAPAPRLVRAVVNGALRLALAGVVLGSLIALFAGRAAASLLFQESPRDPLVFGGVAALLLGSGALAAALPARRASHADPASALRAE